MNLVLHVVQNNVETMSILNSFVVNKLHWKYFVKYFKNNVTMYLKNDFLELYKFITDESNLTSGVLNLYYKYKTYKQYKFNILLKLVTLLDVKFLPCVNTGLEDEIFFGALTSKNSIKNFEILLNHINSYKCNKIIKISSLLYFRTSFYDVNFSTSVSFKEMKLYTDSIYIHFRFGYQYTINLWYDTDNKYWRKNLKTFLSLCDERELCELHGFTPNIRNILVSKYINLLNGVCDDEEIFEHEIIRILGGEDLGGEEVIEYKINEKFSYLLELVNDINNIVTNDYFSIYLDNFGKIDIS